MEQTVDNTENTSVEVKEDRNFEVEASKLGWQPKEKFRGDESKWIDAQAYVERGETVLPIVKNELRKTREELAEVKKAAQEFAAFNEAAKAREVSEWKTKYETVVQEKAAALTQGDGEKFVDAEARQKELEATRPQTKQEAPKLDPEFKSWLDENPWYQTDEEKTLQANLIGASLAKKGLKGRVLYDAVNERLAEFEKASSGTARGGPQRGGKVAAETKGAKTYENLKPEFREQCDRSQKFFGAKVKPEEWRKSWLSKADDEMFRS